MRNWQVTSAIAKLFRDFATSLPASEPLNQPNPLEGKTLAIIYNLDLLVVTNICYGGLGIWTFQHVFGLKNAITDEYITVMIWGGG